MSARHSQSFLVGIFVVLNLLSSVTLADPVAPVAPVTSVTPVDPKKLMVQAGQAIDNGELDVAVKLYAQAAEQNYTPAQVAIGELNDSAQYYEEAVGWFLMAATQGDEAGQYDLGQMYLRGNGIEKNETKALYWIKRSASKNYLPAVHLMAGAYRSGGFSGLIKIDLDQAKSWDAKAERLEAIERKIIDEKLAAMKAAQIKLQEEAAKKANK